MTSLPARIGEIEVVNIAYEFSLLGRDVIKTEKIPLQNPFSSENKAVLDVANFFGEPSDLPERSAFTIVDPSLIEFHGIDNSRSVQYLEVRFKPCFKE